MLVSSGTETDSPREATSGVRPSWLAARQATDSERAICCSVPMSGGRGVPVVGSELTSTLDDEEYVDGRSATIVMAAMIVTTVMATISQAYDRSSERACPSPTKARLICQLPRCPQAHHAS